MKTLVIHPDDRSTDFLKIIYEGKDYTVITQRPVSMSYLIKKIKGHDRIMMMGHGTPHGLIGYNHLFMSLRIVKLLRERECVCIWCNADQYVERFGLKGFYTGMFISEVGEARYFDIDADQPTVDYSNNLFVELMKTMVESPNVLNEIKSSYIGDNPVIRYNNDRLYYSDTIKPVDDVYNDYHKMII